MTDVAPAPGRIAMVLDASGLETADVARACAVPESTVAEWRVGVRQPTSGQLEAVARLAGVTTEFLQWPDPDPPALIFVCRRGRGCEIIDTRPAEVEQLSLFGPGVAL